jgi:hydrogenase nickel incorporation protein HypB
MCASCGCGGEHDHGHAHGHAHDYEHDHGHDREHGSVRRLRLERAILEKNDAHARENRAWLARREVTAVNLIGAPGAGKTALLEATLKAMAGLVPISVIEGDQQTERDAARIRAAGGRAVQLNTGTGCHLDAHAVGHALEELDPPPGSLVVIENVGNLVCPALFDLGEKAKVVVLSVAEGEDKPVKYPHMFRASEVLVVSKVDLLPHLQFDVEQCLAHAREVQPWQRVLRASAATGEGIEDWCRWLRELASPAEAARAPSRVSSS